MKIERGIVPIGSEKHIAGHECDICKRRMISKEFYMSYNTDHMGCFMDGYIWICLKCAPTEEKAKEYINILISTYKL